MRKLILFALAIIFFYSPVSAQWLEWQDITSTNLTVTSVANSDGQEKDLEAADLNNDGFADVISVRKQPFSNSTEPPQQDLLLMNVNGELIDQTSQYAPGFISTPTHARDVYIGDLDDDGWQDVVFANTFDQAPLYYRNRGNDNNGNWLGLIDESAIRFPSTLDDAPLVCAVKAADLTEDGNLDLYFCNYKQNNGTAKDFLFVNDGNGFFTAEGETRLGELRNSAFGTEVELKDIDNDGDTDVIKVSTLFNVAPWNNRGVLVLYNNGNGTFTNWQNITLPFTNSPYMIEVEDFNNDGQLDLFVVDDGTDFSLISNTITPNSNITFTQNLAGAGGFGGNVHTADFDLDGDLDVAVADVDVDIPPCLSAREFIFFENNNGVFSDPYLNVPNVWANNTYDFAILDLNNDGLKDVIQGNCAGYTLLLSDNCDIAPANADFDLDGISDACDPCPTNPDINCSPNPNYPTVDTNLSLPRQWNELLLESIRLDLARPTVHARNLFHTSIAMWDAWSVYNDEGCTYLLGETIDGFNCPFDGFTPPTGSDAELEETISYAMYRILTHRFGLSNNGFLLKQAYDNHMQVLGYDITVTTTNYASGDPAALGNYIGQCIINLGLQDNSNEQNDFANTSYQPVNPPMVVDNSGNPTISDPNNWQPLTLEIFIDQSGNVIPGATPDFLSPEWGQVTPYSLTPADRTVNQRDGFSYWVYHDEGAPPTLEADGSGQSDAYKWGFETVVKWSSHLDPTDGVMWDISPNNMGNPNSYPSNIASYPNFYDQTNGGTTNNGYNVNPSTGQAYASNIVPRGDFARVLAEFWADGPDSETPPGHWFTILNENVADHPSFQKRFQGTGPILSDMEWYIKSYLMLGGGMHDAAITAWGNKGWYDYTRPISAIRYMADKGQSSNSALPNYDPQGMPLTPGYIEQIQAGDPLAGAGNVNVGKIKIKAWRGHEVIQNVDTDVAGVDWILAEDWVPYQRPSFVTPPFAGYVSGHSTFSSAAATIITNLTGDAYFPGGLGTYTAPKDEFLVFEDGPSVDVVLQWATYQDAADQSALSRIWGGIHPPADDIPGRRMGEKIGTSAFNKTLSFFQDNNNNGAPDLCEPAGPCDNAGGDADGDGICDNSDCDNTDPNLPATVGSTCNDGNANTENDVILADGCTCEGTPISTGCNSSFVQNGNSVTFSGLTDPVNSVKIINLDYSTYWECVSWSAGCNTNEIINNIPDGQYYISLNTYDAGWNVICNIFEIITIDSGNGCVDNDNDGFCIADDCDDNNPSVPANVGTSCNDGNPNTENDVILADGCTCEGTIIGCTDNDNDGFCLADDCNDNDPTIPATVGSSCNDGNSNTENDAILADGCTCEGTPINPGGCNIVITSNNSAITLTGMTDNDVNAKIFNTSWQEQWGCNPWNGSPCSTTETYNNVTVGTTYYVSIVSANCNIFEVVTVTGGGGCTDNDNDGFCVADDCNDNNPNVPAAVGTTCNDGNSNTENDVILADGCTCEGTPIGPGGCNSTYTLGNGSITFNNLTDPVNAIKVIDATYTTVWECNSWAIPCNTSEIVSNLPAGDYIVSLNTYDAGWNVICNIYEVVTISGGNGCPDADNDGTCDVDDCAPTNPNLPAIPGTTCNDFDANTTDDVILADGCTCQGTSASNCVAAYAVNGNTVTFSNINDPVAAIKIIYPDFTTYWECNTWETGCNATTTINNIPNGNYIISLNTYDAGWNVICNIFESITINNALPLVQPFENKVNELAYDIYPNPFEDILTIKFVNDFEKEIEYEIYSSHGVMLMESQMQLEAGKKQFHIETDRLKSGYYLLKIKMKDQILSKPIIKM